MVVKTYFDKDNTLISNSYINTGLNPITQLFYGGVNPNVFSRFIFHFDETKLVSLHTNGTFPDTTKLTHTLKMTNTGAFDKSLLNGNFNGMSRASSFDLIVFALTQPFDEGVGYDFEVSDFLYGNAAFAMTPSNWFSAQTATSWSVNGVYSGSPTVIGSQHFDAGNENISIDVTSYVNSVLGGAPNYGLGVAFIPRLESITATTVQYVGFFTRNTQTFYEPYIETIYNNHISDDRNNFFLDKPNKLYLYVNLGGEPTNLDSLPNVNIFDNSGNLINAFSTPIVQQVTKGVYSVDLTITSAQGSDGYLFNDIWTPIVINGVTRPDINLNFEIKDSLGYYDIGANDIGPKSVAVSIAGIRKQDRILRGDIRKIIVNQRIPYTVAQTQNISNIQYRLYVTEGRNEVTVIDFQPIEKATNYQYFLLDTASLLPNTYYLDILVESNLEVTTLKNVINFDIVSESNTRTFQ